MSGQFYTLAALPPGKESNMTQSYKLPLGVTKQMVYSNF